MKGLFLRRVFPEPAPKTVTITVTGTGNNSYCHVTINGTKVVSAGTHEVEPGSTIVCFAYAVTILGSVASFGSVVLNGTEVAGGSSTVSYNYAVTKNATINLGGYKAGANTVITITEE